MHIVVVVIILLLVSVGSARGRACLNTHDAGLVVQLGLKRPIDITWLGNECRKCFWQYEYCKYDDLDDCDLQFTRCSGFPDHPESEADFATSWLAVNSQPNLFFTDAIATDIVGVRSLRNLANDSVLVEGRPDRIVRVRHGDVIAANAGKLNLGFQGLPAENLQLSSITHRRLSNGTEIVAYLDYDDHVQVARRSSRNTTWNIQQLGVVAGANPALEVVADDVHVLYPAANLTLMHWSSTTGLVATELRTRFAVALGRTGQQRLVMLLQNVLTAGLDVSLFGRRWSPPQPTSQNVDPDIAPVFVSNDDEPARPRVLFARGGRLHMMTYRDLRVSPSSWMHDLAPEIGDVPMTKLQIPGSHDSGSYGITAESALGPIDRSHRDLADLFANPLFSPIARHVARRWSRAQGRSLLGQLHAGIRYLDLRVTSGSKAFPPISFDGDLVKDMFIEHMMISVPIRDALQQIKTFLDDSPNEFLILDLQHLTWLDIDRRMSLYDEIERLFPTQKAMRTSAPSKMTLNQIWAAGYQLMIIVCSEEDERPWLWPRTRSLISPWPNVPDPKQLKDALAHGFATRDPDLFFVLQGVCTENVVTVAEGFLGRRPRSLRELAASTSPLVLQWMKDWPDMNIVIVDWIEDSSLVASCIEANLEAKRR